MSRTVKISKTAEKKISKLFDYLLEEWSLKVKSDFVQKLYDSIELIRSDPNMFPESDKNPGLHKCVITKQTTLYYRFTSKTIFVITIFDNRQKPSKLKKEIK